MSRHVVVVAVALALGACATTPTLADYAALCRGNLPPGTTEARIGDCAKWTQAQDQAAAAAYRRQAMGQALMGWGQMQTYQSMQQPRRPVICNTVGPGTVVCQ